VAFCGVVQCTPHAPQFSTSVVVSVHREPQIVNEQIVESGVPPSVPSAAASVTSAASDTEHTPSGSWHVARRAPAGQSRSMRHCGRHTPSRAQVDGGGQSLLYRHSAGASGGTHTIPSAARPEVMQR
jgi:hypothetical protein